VAAGARFRDAATQRAEWAILRSEGFVDLRRLRRAVLSFPRPAEIVRVTSDLDSVYQRYVSEVSIPGMAVSLETGALLLALCRTEQVSSAIDYGSGFSSYVLRRWAGDAHCDVVSVDDDPAWLARTHDFLVKQRVSDAHLCLWPDVPNQTFDLVFHDFAGGRPREETMPMALQAASRFAVFDEAQHRGHRAAIRTSCAHAGVPLSTASELWPSTAASATPCSPSDSLSASYS
jgi:hypothetical protein